MYVLFRGSIEQKARLVTGLTLFAFALTHFLNHALGLYSVELMQAVEGWRFTVTRSMAGGIILASAIVIHVLLGLRKLAMRSTLKMPFWEAAQVALGLSIPLLLIPHLVPMRFSYELFGSDTTYLGTLLAVWKGRAWQQTALLLIVWTHACIGLHFWLRLSKWYPKALMPLFALAVAIPLAGLAGFMVSGRGLEAKVVVQPAKDTSSGYGYGADSGYGKDTASGADSGYGNDSGYSYGNDSGGKKTDSYSYGNDSGYGTKTDSYGYGASASKKTKASTKSATLAWWTDSLSYIFIGLLGLTALVYSGRKLAGRFGKRVEIQYAQGPTVKALAGPTLLEISRMHNVPHVSVCGGRGRCSTCRVRIEGGGEGLGPRNAVERRTLASINAGPDDRLACQIRPSAGLDVIRILRPGASDFSNKDFSGSKGRGEERDLAVLFLDVRGFTSMSAGKLPYDVVYILNELFAATGQAIQADGGWIDKYLGDGLMAVFGRECSVESGCRQALRAARAIDLALDNVNAAVAQEAGGAIRIGIGLHVGPLVLGEIGHKGSASMTVIGRTVNAAARLEALTKDMQCQLIISSDVAKRAGLPIQDLPQQSVEVRGIPEPLDVICFTRARDMQL